MKKGTVALLSSLVGGVIGFVGSDVLNNKKNAEKQERIDKFKNYYNMLNQWLILKQDKKTLISYFEENNYKKIAIYGMGEMGNRLYDELKGSNIEISYVIDQNAMLTYAEVPVIDPEEDEFEEVDVIIVTATFAFDEITEIISGKCDCDIVSLDDVVFGV